MIKGKQGRFRQNLLGKRVDYSGRSVVVPDPTLKLHQYGIPKEMAIELFKPFIFNRLEEESYAAAKKLVEKETPEVWNALEEVLQEHPVLLNRQPTLHKFNMMAFDPMLVEGKALRLHPLVCKAFNADFDGDTMAVHVPLSLEAQIEARVLMSSVNNILTPANGSPVIEPTQDIVLGIYYLTREKLDADWNGMIFSDADEVRNAYDAGVIDESTKIKARINGEIIETTTGRILFKEILPCGFPFHLINKTLRRDDIRMIIGYLYSEFGAQDTVEFLNRLLDLGFHYATKSRLSICMDDIVVPSWKDSIVEDARNKEKEYISEFQRKEDEDDEFPDCLEGKKKIVHLWQKTSDIMEDEVRKTYEKTEHSFNSIRMMIDSGARGNWNQLSQLVGIKGFISTPSEENMPSIITANYIEGLSPFDYFRTATQMRVQASRILKHGTDAGWLMRRLVDVVQDIIITEEDCGTLDGIDITPNKMNDILRQSLEERIIGRISAEEIRHPETGEIFLKPNEEITKATSEKLAQSGIGKIKIRSVLTCLAKSGVCAKCYGRDLSTGLPVNVGEAIGISAAQSIGGPVTQSVFDMRHEYHIMPENKTQVFLSKLLALFEARKPGDSSSADYKNILVKNGMKDACSLLLDEFQSVFRQHKIFIADKHFEVIMRRMTEKIKVEDAGDTLFLKGELVKKQRFIEENAYVQFEGGRPAIGKPVILGITKTSLSSDSWISAASFQETTKVLTEAAISGSIDELRGLKENVLMGRIIPAGTGMTKFRNTFVKRETHAEFNKDGEPINE